MFSKPTVKTKKILLYFTIFLTISIGAVLSRKEVNKITNIAIERYSRIKNSNLKKYLKDNERLIEKSCLDEDVVIEYYLSIYKEIIRTLHELNKKNLIKTKDRRAIYKLLKKANMKEVYSKIKQLSLTQINSSSLSDKNILLALAAELTFFDFKAIDDLIKQAINLNQFNTELYLRKAKIYTRNCKIDDAINIMLEISSISTNDGNFSRFYEIYKMLGDNYFIRRDYENSFLYYTNAMSYVNYNEDNNVGKFKVLTKIGDIMIIKGNIFEGINFYKYALGKTSKIKKLDRIETILKLSNAYYIYGNYENGLKFAEMAENIAISISSSYLISKSKLMKCLNYEYLSKEILGRKECEQAEKIGLLFQNSNPNDYSINAYLGYMYNFPAYLRNFTKSEEYFNMTLELSKHNVYKRIEILEKKAALYSYNREKLDEAMEIFEELDKLYKTANVKNTLSKNILQGYVLSLKNKNLTENIYYNKAERELENYKAILTTLYSYMSDFYFKNNNKVLARYYATKALETAKQVYKYDHHYINYMVEKINNLAE